MKNKSEIRYLYFLSILIATMISTSTSLANVHWWDTNWKHRKQVAITNNVDANLYDYSIMISLNTAELISQGKMQSDCGDIRIIENGIEIDYGLINPDSVSTEICFIVNDLVVGNNNDIYIYYGNPDTNNGFVENWKDAFYIWYDDFDSDRGWYDYWDRGVSWTISDGHLTVYFSPYRDGAIAPADGSSFPMDERVGIKTEAKMMVLNNRWCQGQIALSWQYSISNISVGHQRYNLAFSDLIYTSLSTHTWYITETVYNRLTGDWYGTLRPDGHPSEPTQFGNRPALESDDFSTIMVSSCNGTTPVVDYIYLRYFIEPEPSYSLGPEEYLVIKVAVDIKPSSCPNPLNVKSKGVLPVAILGTEDIDVTDIDVASILLEGVDPIRSSYEDVATPVLDGNECDCTAEGPDGHTDLTLKFKTQEIVSALCEVNHGDIMYLKLEGALFDETPIKGANCIVIRGKARSLHGADINGDGVVNMLDFAIMSENWLQSTIEPEKPGKAKK